MSQLADHPFSLAGKRILITGASSGIGRSCAIEMSKLGASIVLVARRGEQLEQTRSMLAGASHIIAPIDLTSGENIITWMKKISMESGLLDGLVHAAGISTTMPIRATSQELFGRIISTNLESAYFIAKAFRQKGVRSTKGSIVLIGSVMSLVGQPGLTAYCASKGALVTLAKSLALELASENIRVNVVAPGHVHTPMADIVEKALPESALRTIVSNHPLGIGKPEDVAYACAYLLSDAARWVSGTTLVVDGAYTAS